MTETEPSEVAIPRARYRLGLRARVAASFGLGALVLSVLLALFTYTLVSRYLILQREQTTLRQAQVNARVVEDALLAPRPDIPELLAPLHRSDAGSSVLFNDGQWYASSLQIGKEALPVELRDAVRTGQPSRQRIVAGNQTRLAVGLPLPRVGGAYFEVFPLEELARALHTLAVVLIIAAAVTTGLGIVLGQWASRRALRPLGAVTTAAAAIAEGRLDARLDDQGDPDLTLLSSAFNETAAALERRVASDARFAADVSHELRSPLTTMLNAIAVLQARRRELSAGGVEALDLLTFDVRRFDRMVRELLEISRLHDGRPDLQLEEFRLAELVRHAADATAGRPVTAVAANAENLLVCGDKRRLERVFVNLVENAEMHGRGVVRVAVESAGGRVRCLVEDNGSGLADDQKSRIFERYARGTTRRASDAGTGVGLGLALSAEHVRLHDGRIWAENRPGGGARFVVELPVAS